jgi:hypothetical protein
MRSRVSEAGERRVFACARGGRTAADALSVAVFEALDLVGARVQELLYRQRAVYVYLRLRLWQKKG